MRGATGVTIQPHQILRLSRRKITYLIIITYETSFTMRGATGVTIQPHQILHRSRRKTRMLSPHHIWNLIYMRGATGVTVQPHQILRLSRRKTHLLNLQCAEQQVSRSNLTKYCACHAERLTYLVLIAYETSFTVRGATGVTIQPHQILRLPRKMTRLLYRPHIWNVISNARSNRCHYPTSPNTAPATQNWIANFLTKSLKTDETSFPTRGRSDHDPTMIRAWSEHDPTMIRPWKRKPQPASQVRLLFELPRRIFYCKIQCFEPNLTFKHSPSAAPATKSNTWPSPNTAPTTKSNTWTSPNTAPTTKSNTWPSPNTAPTTVSNTWTSPNTAPTTKSATWTSPNTAPATKSDTWTSPSTAPATKSDTWTSPSTAPATKNDSTAVSSSHMKRHFQCAEQHVSLSNLPKYCTCHEKWHCKMSKKISKNRWNVISIAGPIRPWSENDPTMIRAWSEHENANRNPPRKWGYFARSPEAFSIVNYNVLHPILHSNFHQILRLPRKVPLERHQVLRLPQKVTLELHQLLRLPRKVTLELHQVLRLPRKMTRLLYRPHIWNVISNARSNTCHYPTSPNTAPATKNDTARCQRKSPKTGETSFPLRGRSDHDPRMIRPWSEHENANRNPPRKWGYFARSPEAFSIVNYNVLHPILHSNFHQILRLPGKVPLERHQVLRLPQKVTLELHQLLRLPWKVTLELHQILPLPRKVTLDLHQILPLPR